MSEYTNKPLSALNTSLTRRKLLTRVVPAGLAVSLLGASASTASVHAFTQKRSAPFLTNVAPGAAGGLYYGPPDQYYYPTIVTATSTDGRMFYNWWNLGEGAHGWREIDGNWQTDATPAVALGGYAQFNPGDVSAYSVIKGLDGYIYMNTNNGLINGHLFQGWKQLVPFQTNFAPAVALNVESGVVPAIVTTSTDGRIFLGGLSSKGGDGWLELDGNGRTDAAPAAAMVGATLGVASPYLFVAVKGLNGQIYLNQGQDGPFVGWGPMGFTTNVAPGATSAGNTTVLTAASTDGRIFYTWWNLGEGARPWREIEGGGRTDATPAASLVGENNDYLFVVVKGPDGQIYLNQGQLGGSFVGWGLL